ncbi:MAG TPA: hypothetical protein PLL64_05775 [Rhodothermales bacterium]|nr:hypothetical protein [Bacteroidota bacterium]HRK73763.1 hypothetical protein [Rhodothermales bacterium]HRR10159.1 hypothetical protein [Rhodothermales bacterium]
MKRPSNHYWWGVYGRHHTKTRFGCLVVLLGAWILLSPSILGQTSADSTLITQRPLPDSLRLGFRMPEYGVVLGSQIPARTPHHQTIRLLSEMQGGYTHDLGADGWPHGWSAFGFLPQYIGFQVEGTSFRDLLSGAPRFDLVPLAWLSPLKFSPEENTGLPGLSSLFRSFTENATPTEMRYNMGGDGLQSASVLHAQNRMVKWFKKNARTQFLMGVASDKAENAFNNAKSVGSALILRVRYERPNNTFEVRNLHTRRRGEAHAGVLPSGSDFDTIYDTRIGLVRDAGRNRQTKWNDFALVHRKKYVRHWVEPLITTAFWQYEQFRSYTQTLSDTQEVRLHRYGFRLDQSTSKGRTWTAEWSALHLKPTVVIPATQWWWPEVRLGIRDSLSKSGFRLMWHSDIRWTNAGLLPNATYRVAKGRLWSSAGAGLAASSPFASFGINHLMAATVGLTRHIPFAWLQVGWKQVSHHWRTEASGFVGFYRGNARLETDLRISLLTENRQSLGGAFTLGWRDRTAQGWFGQMYAQLQTTTSRQTVPLLSGSIRYGLRFSGFEQDLIAKTYLQMRYYTAHEGLGWSNRLDLWGVVPEEYPAVPTAVLIDVAAEAQIRTATLHFAAENLLAGFSFFPGTYLVPTFPLPAQALRFSVFWPLD